MLKVRVQVDIRVRVRVAPISSEVWHLLLPAKLENILSGIG